MSRKMLFFLVAVVLFAAGVLIWFLFGVSSQNPSTVLETKNPLSLREFPRRIMFILTGNEDISSTSTTEVTFATPQVLTEIWNKPASGQVFVTQEYLHEVTSTSTVIKTSTTTKATSTEVVTVKRVVRSTSTVLLFVDRATGYVYGFSMDTNKVFQISNTTLPGIHDAYIIQDGKRVVLRYEDTDKGTIITLLASIPQVTQGQDPKPLENITYLPSEVTSIAVNKARDLLSYIVSTDKGISVYTLQTDKPTLVGYTPFKEWTLIYGGSTLYAYSNPSAYVEGYVVKIPSLQLVTPARTGLMSNPSERGLWLHSMWSSTGLLTYLSDGMNDIVLQNKTLAPKCVWNKNSTIICATPKETPREVEGLPDDWFQGSTLFDDSLITIDGTTGDSAPLFSFDGAKEKGFDVVNMVLSSDDNLLAFTRKQNSSLWLLNRTLLSSEN
jgi:hypothetical protein